MKSSHFFSLFINKKISVKMLIENKWTWDNLFSRKPKQITSPILELNKPQKFQAYSSMQLLHPLLQHRGFAIAFKLFVESSKLSIYSKIIQNLIARLVPFRKVNHSDIRGSLSLSPLFRRGLPERRKLSRARFVSFSSFLSSTIHFRTLSR